MRKKFISIALTLVMVLSLFPVSALAAETDPVVAGYGFLWDQPNDSTELVEGATKGADWMGETMYVYLSNAGSTSTNLWFQVTENNKVWGCAATGKEGPCTYAFSFLNRTSQWEQYPKLTGDNAEFGSEKPHATEYLTTGEVTLKVFTPATAITRGANGASANPTTDELGDPIFEATINIAEGTDVKESAPTHEAPTLTFNKIDADTEILGKKVSELGDFTVAADKTTPTTINVSGTAKYVTGYTQFNEAVADEQEGNYVALKVNKPVADDVTVKLGDKTLGFTDENNTCEYLVLRFTQGKTFKVTATAGDKSTEYTISFTGTLTAKPGTEPEAPTLTFDKIDANTEILGKKVSDLGNFTVATSEKAVTVSGTSNYVTGYEQFNVSVPDEQEGNYVALKVNKPAADGVTVKLGDKTLGFTDENNTCEYLVLRFTQDKTFKVTATAGDKSTEYTISFNGTLTPKPESTTEATATITPTTETKTDSDGNTTLATTAKVETNKITDAIDKAKKDEAEKDENVSADDVKVSAVTITAKTTETSGAPVTEATVEIPKEVTKVLQENEVKETKIETNVGTVTLPAEVLDKAKEPDGSEATKTLIVEVKKAETSITDTETKESIAATFTVEVKTKVEGSSGEATKAEINGLEKPITLRFPIPEEVTDASKLMLAYVKDGAIKRISRSWLGTGNDAGYILGEINHLTEIIIVDQASISDYYVITEITNSKGQQINRVTIKLNGNFDGTQYLYYQVTNGTGTSAVTTGSGNTINKGSNTVTIDIPATATSAKIWLLAGLPTWSTWTDAIGVEQYDFNNLLTK